VALALAVFGLFLSLYCPFRLVLWSATVPTSIHRILLFGILTFSFILGASAGVWCGFCLQYSWSPELCCVGFPVPVAFRHNETGLWMDYINEEPLLIGICDALMVALGCVTVVGTMYKWSFARNHLRIGGKKQTGNKRPEMGPG
jgi:hypothetical protein